jgi:hypothetical protein
VFDSGDEATVFVASGAGTVNEDTLLGSAGDGTFNVQAAAAPSRVRWRTSRRRHRRSGRFAFSSSDPRGVNVNELPGVACGIQGEPQRIEEIEHVEENAESGTSRRPSRRGPSIVAPQEALFNTSGGRWATQMLKKAALEGKALSGAALRTLDTLRHEEWKFFDDALVEEALIRSSVSPT